MIMTIRRLTILLVITAFGFAGGPSGKMATEGRDYNGPYQGPFLNRVAFPVGGIGGGMFCLEGTGAISHLSVRNVLQFFNEPRTFAALCVKGETNVARVLEGPVPSWKIFGAAGTGNGASGMSYGLPRFKGGWWDALTLTWKNIREARLMDNPPQERTSPGASPQTF